MTCKRYSAKEMMNWGLVNSVVKKDKLDEEVKKYGDEILKAAPTCLKILKASFRKQFEEILKITQKGMVEEVAPDYFKTGEQAEGAKAFLEKKESQISKNLDNEKIKSIKAITLSMPFSHGGKKVIFHGKEWKSLEFNLVKIETDKGITGWGEAFGYTSWKAVKIAIEEMVAPLLVGKDMSNIPELLLTLQKSLHLFGRYGITMFAISGVEIALWDALGKEKNKPIHELLGKKIKIYLKPIQVFLDMEIQKL